MEANNIVDSGLNEQQMLMLRLLKTPLPDADFAEIRRLAVKLLSEKLDDTLEIWEADNKITSVFYNQLANKHFRNTSLKG